MAANTVHLLLLVTSISSICALAVFKPRRLEHYLFAILAFSLVLLSVGQLLPKSFAVEQQFVALGTFATCNVFWLLSRAIFRKGNALSMHHYVLAGVIALLILMTRTIDVFVSLEWIAQDTVVWLKRSLSEMLRLLSPAVLLLAFWEAIRSYSSSNKRLRKQKMLIASTMVIAVVSTRVVARSIPATPEVSEMTFLWVRSIAASLILISTFTVLWMQYKDREALGLNTDPNDREPDEDDALILAMQNLMAEQKPYLKSELKMIDIANALGEPEYKISRVLREKTRFDNFNHFVNYFRVEHAKHLLVSEDSQGWTILVISMESGFASLATFNRVFKSQEGCTPNQYRSRSKSEIAEEPAVAK